MIGIVVGAYSLYVWVGKGFGWQCVPLASGYSIHAGRVYIELSREAPPPGV